MSRRPHRYDVEAHWSSSDDEGYSYSAGGRHRGGGAASNAGTSGYGVGRHCRWVVAGWIVALGLLGVWYSEHVNLNTRIVELNGALIAPAVSKRALLPTASPHAKLIPPCCANIWRRRVAGAAVGVRESGAHDRRTVRPARYATGVTEITANAFANKAI
jgi:hypothetical protein